MTDLEMIQQLVEKLDGFVRIEKTLKNEPWSLMGKQIKESEELLNLVRIAFLKRPS